MEGKYRLAAVHRFDNRKAEALEERRKKKSFTVSVQPGLFRFVWLIEGNNILLFFPGGYALKFV